MENTRSKKAEKFDLSAEESVADLLGMPLTQTERKAIYDMNMREGRVPSNLRTPMPRNLGAIKAYDEKANNLDRTVGYAANGE